MAHPILADELVMLVSSVASSVEREVQGAVEEAFSEHVRKAREHEESVRSKTFRDAIEVAKRHECRNESCDCRSEIAVELELARLGG